MIAYFGSKIFKDQIVKRGITEITLYNPPSGILESFNIQLLYKILKKQKASLPLTKATRLSPIN